MPWPFCPMCGTVLDLPESGDVQCGNCGNRSTYESFGNSDVVTRGKDRPVPYWMAKLQQTGRERKQTRTTVEEICPKCGHPEMEFYTMQLRSADEGQTVFYECIKCRYKYSVNN